MTLGDLEAWRKAYRKRKLLETRRAILRRHGWLICRWSLLIGAGILAGRFWTQIIDFVARLL